MKSDHAHYALEIEHVRELPVSALTLRKKKWNRRDTQKRHLERLIGTIEAATVMLGCARHSFG